MAALAGEYVAQHSDALDAVIEGIADAIDLSEADRDVDEIFANRTSGHWSPAARQELLIAYIGFSFWDVLTFSVTQWRDLGEFDTIRVDRISPDDATAIRTGTAATTLKGVELKHFGAFFSRAHRENDYLWGRLHAAERLIDIVYDAARAESAMITAAEVNALKRRAFLAILDAEKPHLGQSADLIAALREEIGAAIPAEPAPESIDAEEE